MKERPIIFTGESVRAILECRKTQTRRVMNPQPKVVHAIYGDASAETERIFRDGDQRIHCPYGKPGERLWVREKFTYWPDRKTCCYPRNYPPFEAPEGRSWRSPLFMPRWASRITLEITSVGVERVQDISEEDAMAEGCYVQAVADDGSDAEGFFTAKFHFMEIWDSINAKRGFGWDKNPWVWVIEFKKIN